MLLTLLVSIGPVVRLATLVQPAGAQPALERFRRSLDRRDLVLTAALGSLALVSL